jgi:hypothetical protein
MHADAALVVDRGVGGGGDGSGEGKEQQGRREGHEMTDLDHD